MNNYTPVVPKVTPPPEPAKPNPPCRPCHQFESRMERAVASILNRK